MKQKPLLMATLALAIPSIVQQLFTNAAQMADNLMVGQLQESAIAGVTITNQVFFIFTLVIFGITSAAGIYMTQYFGTGNKGKMLEIFRISLLFGLLTGGFFYAIMHFFPRYVLSFFASSQDTIAHAKEYLRYIQFTFLLFPVTMMVTSGFRFNGYVRLPMYLSLFTVAVGIFLNYGLIHGNFGMPALGVAGAGLATLIARVLEMSLAILLTLVLDTPIKLSALKVFGFTKELLMDFIKKGYGLVMNEFFWAFGVQALTVIYTQRISANIASLSISQALGNLIFIGTGGMSVAFSIILGEHLGRGEFGEAKDKARSLLRISAGTGLILGALVFLLSFPLFGFYDVAPATIQTARTLLLINAVFSWLYYINAGLYFILRSGGDTKGVVMIDSGFNWIIMIPVAFLLGRFEILLPLHFLLVQLLELLKLAVGRKLTNRDAWLKNLT
ncbi:MAG: MATE family efflux transporter [Turicibacter sp.]|nr:MATE family efflux transporter [Turicibacter sp.]